MLDGAALGGSHGFEHRIVLERAAHDGQIGGDGNSGFVAEIDQLAVLQIGMAFDLVVGDGALAQNRLRLLQQGDGEIGDADGLGEAQRLGFGQLLQIDGERHFIARRGPVNEGEIDRIDADGVEAAPQRGNKLAGAVIGHVDLGGDEDVGAGEAGLPYSLAAFALGIVALGGIEMAIADFERGEDGGSAFGTAAAKGAEAQ